MPDQGSARQAEAGAIYLNLDTVRLAAFASRDNDAENAGAGSAAGNLTVNFANTKSTALLAAVDASPSLTFKGGWEHIVTSLPSNPGYDATMTSLSGVNVSSVVATSGVSAYTNPRIENMYWIGASFALAPTLKVNGGFYERTTSEYGKSTTCTPNGVGGGVGSATICATSSAKYYVGEVINSLSKRTDVYVNASYTQLAGPVWSNYFPSQLSVATGMRHSF
jgi:predicted porin